MGTTKWCGCGSTAFHLLCLVLLASYTVLNMVLTTLKCLKIKERNTWFFLPNLLFLLKKYNVTISKTHQKEGQNFLIETWKIFSGHWQMGSAENYWTIEFQVITCISYQRFRGCLCHRRGEQVGIIWGAKGELALETISVNLANFQKFPVGMVLYKFSFFPRNHCAQ